MTIREKFPSEEKAREWGGRSDGKVFVTAFRGASLEDAFELVRQFLAQEGYANVPLPADAVELEKFRFSSQNGQLLLFGENGYIHNPVKILFHNDRRKKNTLILKIYNEKAPQHLLRFHGRLPEGE